MEENLEYDHSTKPSEQYFPMVLFIMQYKVFLSFSPHLLSKWVKAFECYTICK